MLDKLDKLEERINHFFTKGKNANERCFDFFLRSVTFFIILLAVLLYGGLVHAETSVDTNDYETMNEEYFFTYTELNNHYSGSSASNVYPEINQGFMSNYPPLWSEDRIGNYVSQISGIALNNESSIIDSDYKKYYALFLQIDTGTSEGICRCNLISIYSKDIPLIINDGLTVFNSSLSHWSIYSEYSYVINNTDFQINYANQYLPFQLKGNTKTEVSEGGLHTINGDVTGYLFGCDCNIYSLMYSNIYSGTTSSSKLYSSVSDMVEAIYDDSVTDKPFNLNPKAEQINPEPEPEEPQESNANHLYFKDVEIALTSQGETMNVLSSSVVVGVDVDDWVKNHMNDYYVYINYHVNMKDSAIDYKDPTSGFSQVLPLSTFYNDAYTYGINELFHQLPLSGNYNNFYEYYQHIKQEHTVETKTRGKGWNTYGLIPSLLERIGYNIGEYKTTYSTASNYQIWDFNLEVSVCLTTNPTLGSDVSGLYTKKFDLLNGGQSVTKADGLVNPDPWTGPTDPQANPFGSGSANANGGVIQNNNQNVNINIDNRFKNAVSGGVNDEDTDNTVDNMKKVFDEFKGGLKTISESSMDEDGNPNGFLSLLEHTYNFIPGINYIKTAIIVIVALAVILFILKVLLF